MASRQDTLEDFEQEITCPLCLDTFEDPRVLTCQHTYCGKCLEALISRMRGVSPTLTCPECRKTTDVSVSGVKELPIAFKLNRLIHLVNKMRVEERGKERTAGSLGKEARTEVLATPPQNEGTSGCTQHPGQTLDVYCLKCEDVVCRDCILFGTHSSHSYEKLDVAANEERHAITQKLNTFLKKQASVQKYAADAKQACHSAQESCEGLCGKITESYDRAISALERRKTANLEKFREAADTRVMELNARDKNLRAILFEMGEAKSMVERALKDMGASEFIVQKKAMVLKIDQLNSRINELSQEEEPAEFTPHVLDHESVVEIEAVCNRLVRPYHAVDPVKCNAQIGNGESILKVGQVTKIEISLKDSEGEMCCLMQSVTVELCCVRFGERISGKVIEKSSSSYETSISPNIRTRGQCQVVVRVNDVIVGSKPITIFIECPPRILGDPVHIITNIQQPGCMKIFNNRMYCRTATGVCILDLENVDKPMVQSGLFPRDGKIESWWPSEMAIDGMHLYVSDPRNGKVHKFKLDGQYVKSTPTNKDTLQTPNGLSASPSGALYVCDSDQHCIHVFNSDLSLCATFGSPGSSPGQFCWPDNIAFDSSGNFYITDYSNDRIQCFSNTRTWKWSTEEAGGLKEPNVMQIVGNKIFVTDLGGVSVFNTQGQFVTRFASMCAASASKSSADGIAVDSDGYVFVSDTPRNRIVIF